MPEPRTTESRRSRFASPMRAATALALVALVGGSLALAIPFLTRNRDYPASIPSPHPLFRVDQVRLPRGSPACFSSGVIDTHAAEPRSPATAPGGGGGPPLRLTLSGPGYAHTYPVQGGYSGAAEQYVL